MLKDPGLLWFRSALDYFWKVQLNDEISGRSNDRPGLDSCLKSTPPGDVLIVCKLDRLERSLKHLVDTIHDLADQNIEFKVLTDQGAEINTTTASGKLVFGIFAALAEFERELISERTKAGLAAARARGQKDGRSFKLIRSQDRPAQASMKNRDCSVSE